MGFFSALQLLIKILGVSAGWKQDSGIPIYKKGVREEPGNLSWFRNGTPNFTESHRGSLNCGMISHSSTSPPRFSCGGVEWRIEGEKDEAHGLR